MDCVQKIRQRAQELRRMNLSLSADAARYKATLELSAEVDRYNYAQRVLSRNGVPSLPLK